MKLLEVLDQQDYETAQYDPNSDELNVATMNSTRKNFLSLKHLNRLKRLRALRGLETLKRGDLLGIMYGIQDTEEPGMGMGTPGGF
jgi:hypothetical protein